MWRQAASVLLIATLGHSSVEAAKSDSDVDPSAAIRESVPNQASDPACPPRAILAAQIRPLSQAAGYFPGTIDNASSPEVYLICVAARFPAPGWVIVGRAIYHNVVLIVDGATRKVLATAPIEGMSGGAEAGSPVVKAVDLDGDGVDEILKESWYSNGGDFVRSLHIYRREGATLGTVMDQTLAWDSSGSTGPIYDPEDPASRPPSNPQALLAAYPDMLRYRATWEILPAAAATRPRLRVRTHERIIGPKTAYREAAARFVRDCAVFSLQGRKIVKARCGPR